MAHIKKDPLKARSGNYLLRSAYALTLRKTVALANAGRIRLDGMGIPCVVKSDGSWAGSVDWEVKMLGDRGLVEVQRFMDPTAPVYIKPTRAGTLALAAALEALGETIDTSRLCRDIDAGKALI